MDARTRGPSTVVALEPVPLAGLVLVGLVMALGLAYALTGLLL